MDEEKTSALGSASSDTSEYVRVNAGQQTLGELSAVLASAGPGSAEPFAALPAAQTTRGFQQGEPKWFMIVRIIERHVGTRGVRNSDRARRSTVRPGQCEAGHGGQLRGCPSAAMNGPWAGSAPTPM